MNDQLYFRQLLSGRDFAAADQLAGQMANFAYAIGDRETGECVLVDPAYDVNTLVDSVENDGLRITGVLATHNHADHVGGSMMGYRIQGISTLLERVGVKIHVQSDEAEFVKKVTGVDDGDLVLHGSGDLVMVGAIPIQLLHTPGHTPGSQCFLVDGRLVSGDTLFLDGCGRTDFPGSNPEQMYESLTRLAGLRGDTVLFPGHHYSPPTTHLAMSTVLQSNFVYRPKTREQWLTMFGG